LNERSVGRSGKGYHDHGPGGHNDVANAVAGAVATAPAGCGRKDRNVYLPARVPSESVKGTADVSRSHISGEPERTASA
jgi:hypothetical protein